MDAPALRMCKSSAGMRSALRAQLAGPAALDSAPGAQGARFPFTWVAAVEGPLSQGCRLLL